MTAYGITLDVTLSSSIDPDPAVVLARQWAERAGLTYAGHAHDGARLTLDAVDEQGTPTALGKSAAAVLAEVAYERGGWTVAHWHAIEVLDADEIRARAARPALPPLVDAQQLADLCGVSRTRVYQWDRDRPDHFPAPVVPGYWLAAEARQWARVRPTRPGPRPAAAGEPVDLLDALQRSLTRDDTTGATP